MDQMSISRLDLLREPRESAKAAPFVERQGRFLLRRAKADHDGGSGRTCFSRVRTGPCGRAKFGRKRKLSAEQINRARKMIDDGQRRDAKWTSCRHWAGGVGEQYGNIRAAETGLFCARPS